MDDYPVENWTPPEQFRGDLKSTKSRDGFHRILIRWFFLLVLEEGIGPEEACRRQK